MKKKFIFWAALIVSVLLNVYLIGCDSKDRCDRAEIDTLYIYDTIRIVEPIPVKEEVVRYVYVTLPKEDENIPISNELESNGELSNDSVEVVLPITQRVYEDSTYKAWVSGYEPRLDSIDVYSTSVYYPMYIQKKEKPKFVIGAGLYGGFGTKGADYGLGIMVVVPIWSW